MLLLQSSYIAFDIIDPCTLHFKDYIIFALMVKYGLLFQMCGDSSIFPVRVSYMVV